MSKLRVAAYGVSIDGFAAGPAQSLDDPLGKGGPALMQWAFPTRTFQRMFGSEDGTTGVDEGFAARSFENVGAWIMGRNMFSPHRGGWDGEWRGWWGDNPPYHVPVYVLTHHPRPPLEMEGGTVFHFVTEGIEAALERARESSGGRDIRIGGGAATVRQYVAARLVDELHLAVSPVLLGEGEPLFAGMDWAGLGYRISEQRASEAATHLILTRHD